MKKFMLNEDGQGMVEYALIIALVSIIAIVALIALGRVIRQKFFDISKSMNIKS